MLLPQSLRLKPIPTRNGLFQTWDSLRPTVVH